ncbi:SMI1-KNR4 cell-wall [Ruminococcaceae bacterium YRB3002]|nr:SMI1-KNR4 cell-wall [Ruminococcaceae bacterium YRB3002]
MYGIVTVQIERDANIAKYIKIIRSFDSSLSVGNLKRAIDTGDVVFEFDPDNDAGLVCNGKDNTTLSMEQLFIKTLRELKMAGARMTVLDELGYKVDYEPPMKRPITARRTSDDVMNAISERWNLPKIYLDYLKTHSKGDQLSVEIEDFETTEIYFFGAEDLIEGQFGYSYNPVTEEVIDDWDPNLVVIASSDGDPYCIDISEDDSPVYFAVHGMDEWEWDELSDSLEEFMQMLGLI